MLDVVCLCAEWCVNCRAYRAGFDAQGDHWGARARLWWLDVEDESEVVGELDIENFPSMLLLQGDVPLFLGPVTPQPQVLQQLVQSALDGRLAPLRGDDDLALARRVRAHLDAAT